MKSFWVILILLLLIVFIPASTHRAFRSAPERPSVSLTIMSKDEISSTSVLEKVDEKEDASEPQIPKSE